MFKLSDIFLLLAVIISFTVSVFFMFQEDYISAIFTAIWVPSILVFGIYFKLLGLYAIAKDVKNKCCHCCDRDECCPHTQHAEKNGCINIDNNNDTT